MGDVRIDTLPEIAFALQRREVTEENNSAVNSWQRVERRHWQKQMWLNFTGMARVSAIISELGLKRDDT